VTVSRGSVVWLVDDVASVRKSIRAVLETSDFTVSDYASASDFLADFSPETAGCLVVDQNMPGMTGIELLQQLKARGIALPAIVITGQGDSGLRAKALQAGAITMLDKPVDGVELMALIEANPDLSARGIAPPATVSGQEEPSLLAKTLHAIAQLDEPANSDELSETSPASA